MDEYPDTMDFIGLNAPVRMEVDIRNLPIEGTLPRDLQGCFFRAVPETTHPPLFADDTMLSGDGMISRFLFDDGHVDFAIRYVQTPRFKAEREARRALFGRYRNPFTDDPSVQGIDRAVVNTTPVWHAGRLLMTKEDGRAYEVDPITLDTVGPWDFHGALKSETMTAHVRIDPETGEMFFFGYEAGGLASEDISYCIADKDGNLVSEQWFRAPYAGMMHDFAISEHFAIFPIFPTTTDLDRLKAGGPHWVHHQGKESWIGIMPRYGKVEELRWFKGPPGVSSIHLMNAYEDAEGHVNLDMHIADTVVFPFIRDASKIDIAQQDIVCSLTRWTFDLSRPENSIAMRDIGPPGDLPRVRDSDQGRAYRSAWYLTMDPDAGSPLVSGPTGAAFNCLLRIELGNGRIESMPLPARHAIHEPVHVPSTEPGHDGWLVAVVDREIHEDELRSELWVIDAGNVRAGAVAKVKLPIRLRQQVHGWWVPGEELSRSRFPVAGRN